MQGKNQFFGGAMLVPEFADTAGDGFGPGRVIVVGLDAVQARPPAQIIQRLIDRIVNRRRRGARILWVERQHHHLVDTGLLQALKAI